MKEGKYSEKKEISNPFLSTKSKKQNKEFFVREKQQRPRKWQTMIKNEKEKKNFFLPRTFLVHTPPTVIP
jgi:hypothetical protein